jgi:hypothetical protein
MVKEFYKQQGFDKTKEDTAGNTEWLLAVDNNYAEKNSVIIVEE